MTNCFKPNDSAPAFLVAGPTASGKTALTHALARDLGLEIVSADSMQVYRDVPIATAAPTPAQRREVPYHLIDMLDVAAMYSAGRFLRDAMPHLRRCAEAGRPALVTGGTGLYLRTLVEGLIGFADEGDDEHDARPADAPRTPRQHATTASEAAALHDELRRRDPEAAAAIHANNVVRVRRALALIERTGRPLAEAWRADRDSAPPPATALVYVVLERTREDLVARIERRTRVMWADGVAGEVAALRARLAAERRTLDECAAARALGLGLIARGLESGEVRPDDRPDADAAPPPRLAPYFEAMQRTTRQYAKRQKTWLRKYARTATWIDLTAVGEAAAGETMKRLFAAALDSFHSSR